MNTVPIRLYRFQIEGPLSAGILSAVDEADETRVRLVHVALEGNDSGKKLEALEQVAAECRCETFTNDSDFYFVARSESESSGLAGLIESRGLGAFTGPEFARNHAIASAGDQSRAQVSRGTFPPASEVRTASNPRPRRKFFLWGVPATLLLMIGASTLIWLENRQPAPAEVHAPTIPPPVVRESPQEQGKSNRPTVNEVPPPAVNEIQPPVHAPKSLENRIREQSNAQHQSIITGEPHSGFRPVSPPNSTTQPEPPEQNQTGKADPPPSMPVVQNTPAAPPVLPGPPKISFSADSTQLKLGQTTSLRWDVSGASDIRIEPNPGAVTPSGSLTIRPLGKTVYTLHAVGQGGEVNASVSISISGVAGPTTGQLIWTGNVSGTQLVTIDHDHSDVGTLEGALPRLPCIIQPTNEKKVGIVAAPSPTNNYDRLVLRVLGKGPMRIVIDWSVEF